MIYPTHALSIKQPWAWLIVHGYKDVENRTWRTNRRGPVLVHAGARYDQEAVEALIGGRHPVTGLPLEINLLQHVRAATAADGFPRSGIVGQMEITGCGADVKSPWFVGPFGMELKNAKPLTFMSCKGQLSFFAVDYRP